jgi:membrane-associated HD superfamily phosphohydrolase
MELDLHFISDAVGIVGVGVVIISYFLIQIEKITISSSIYLYSNFFGSIMLLFSLFYHWNLASVIIEILWLLISFFGIIRFKILKKKHPNNINFVTENQR